MNLNGKTILITGGTGSFGQKCVETILRRFEPQRIIIFSRDELKQSMMHERFDHPCLRYFIGDVRDLDRLRRALYGVDIVIHAAALKQVPAIEYNPFEAVRTNIIGAYNIISAAIDCGVSKVIALSTDKAANPINLYGATKLCSDKLFISANHLAGGRPTRFSVVRYGNVVGSRGSVVPLFLRKRNSGILPLTDLRMTRFLITLTDGVDFVIRCLGLMQGGEIFVPKIPSAYIVDVAKAIAPECKWETTGIRPGEKLHEVMIPQEDARNALEFSDFYIIQPPFQWWDQNHYVADNGYHAIKCDEDFTYASNTNSIWLSVPEIEALLKKENLLFDPHDSHTYGSSPSTLTERIPNAGYPLQSATH